MASLSDAQQQDTPLEDSPFELVPMLSHGGKSPEAMLGERLAAARSHYRLSVEALSRLTKAVDSYESKGVSPPSIARYESSESLPGARELRLLCEALAVPADWLIYGRISTAGVSNTEQKLLAVLKAFVAEQGSDHMIAGTPVSESVAFQQRMVRQRLLQEARRPS